MLAILTSCSKDENPSEEKSIQGSSFQVLFENPVSYSKLESQIKQLEIKKSSVVVTHNFLLGEIPFRGFVPLDEISDEASFRETIEKGINGLENEARINIGEYIEPASALVSRSQEIYEISEVMITDVIVDRKTISKIFLESKVIQLKEKNIVGIKEGVIQNSQKSNSDDSWIPDAFGYRIEESTSYPGKRYLLTAMIWATSEPFGEWSDNVTFEPDFNLNDSSGSSLGSGTYLHDGEYANGIPKVYYAASNLPRAYLDTRDTDPNHIKTFTIGCADAADIESFKQYENYIVTNKGDANQDNAQVVFQRGQRFPSNVYNTW